MLKRSHLKLSHFNLWWATENYFDFVYVGEAKLVFICFIILMSIGHPENLGLILFLLVLKAWKAKVQKAWMIETL